MSSIQQRLSALETRMHGLMRGYQSKVIACRVTNSAAQTLTTGTLTAITFDTERRDQSNVHSVASNTSRLLIPVTGWYLIGGHIEFAANATGNRDLYIRLDGSTYIAGVRVDALSDATKVTIVSLSTVYYCTVGQYAELIARQWSGGDLNSSKDASLCPEFYIVKFA